MIRSSSKGTSGFRRTAVVGSRSRIALKINAEVSPRNGSVPVHISYSTAPKEKRSVRASSSFPLTCSGDIYATVPSVEPGLVRCSSEPIVASPIAMLSRFEDTLASPKSHWVHGKTESRCQGSPQPPSRVHRGNNRNDHSSASGREQPPQPEPTPRRFRCQRNVSRH